MRRRAFTLIEMLVALAIGTVLAAVLLPALAGVINGARSAAAASVTRRIHDAVKALTEDTGRSPWQGPGGPNFPSVFTPTVGFAPVTGSSLNAASAGLRLSDGSYRNWRGPYLEEDVRLDPWNREYQLHWDYRVSARGAVGTPVPGVAILSLGPDAAYSADDVRQYFEPAR